MPISRMRLLAKYLDEIKKERTKIFLLEKKNNSL
jgi:hypothetical protein